MTLDEEAIFLEAVEKTSAGERSKYLDEACAGDPARRREIERLLEAHAKADRFLAGRPALAALTGEMVLERPGTQVGPYKLLEQIGEGGFGVVFLAEQIEPVHRQVALKILKPGMDTRQVVARFEAERQALAMMDHPNIARVLDAGATDSGRPYFAMELVKGVPITGFCDERRLTPRERLELCVPVCQAVQHAHQKGVIHRDLKPSNVLVALYDGRPAPRVIDFGVAKAIGQPLTRKTLVTGLGAIVGTPEYMSPEQAELNQLDIDTRSDIYSLGVLLYELLTGSTPLEKKRVQEALLEVLRLVREEEPPRPSTRLSTTEELPRIAANRGLEPKRLSGLVRGDLDWIVMKCLEKDRGRRYETADGLARDINRYLHDEPVEASPPGAGYRLRKFLMRNRGRVAAAGLVLAALLAGMAGTTWGMIRAEKARQDAVSAQFAEAERAEGERRAKEEAQKRAAQIEKGAEILASVFGDLDPMAAEKEGLTSRDLLGRRLVEAAQQLEGEVVGDLLVVARLQHVLGSSLFELGHWKEAKEVLVKASRTRERMLGADHLDTATTKHHLAMLYREQGEYALAERLYREALAVRTAKLGADHIDTAATKHHLAMLHHSQGKDYSAEALLEDVLAIRTARLGADDPDTLTTRHRLAQIYYSQGKYALSETLHKGVLAARTAKLGPDHLDTAATKRGLAVLYQAQGKISLAETLYKEVLAIRIAKLGPDHPDTISIQHRLATLCESQGNLAQAEALYKEVLAGRTATLGPDHPDTLGIRHQLATLYLWQGSFAQAEALYKEVLAGRTAKLGPDHPDTLSTRLGLATLYHWQRNFARAEALYKEVLVSYTEKLGADHLDAVAAKHSLATMYHSQGNHAQAEALYKEVLAIRTAKLGTDHPDIIISRDSLAMLYSSMKKPGQAIPLLEETLELRKAKLGPDAPEILGRQVTLGANACDAGRFGKGISLIEEVRRKGRSDPHPAWVRSALLTAYVQAGKTAEATALVTERVQEAREQFPPDSPELAAALTDNGKALLDAKAYADAELLLLAGYRGLNEAAVQTPPRVEDVRLQGALELLVHLYEAWGRADEAAKWRKELEAARAAGPPKLKGP
ncbi:MAG TPA: tetratricopeptide repeat protein [Gemmatimonadales bacterium]|nr:tetratricopeptide repeat protein [Gemmatimonadales bacterium]